jgi:hypothetical protein
MHTAWEIQVANCELILLEEQFGHSALRAWQASDVPEARL